MNPHDDLVRRVEAFVERHSAAGELPRHWLIVSVTGSRMYGVNGPASDIDLAGIHVEPVRRLCGRETPPTSMRRSGFMGCDVPGGDGTCKVEFMSHELGDIARKLVQGSKHVFDLLHSPFALFTSEARELQRFATLMLTRKVLEQYASQAQSHLDKFETNVRVGRKWLVHGKVAPIPTVKCALHALTPALVGLYVAHNHPAVLTSVPHLIEAYLPSSGAMSLVVARREGNENLIEQDAAGAVEVIRIAIALLRDAIEASDLSTEPPVDVVREFDEWLFKTRMRFIE